MHDPIGVVIQNEGGYTNHSADRGGPTKYGVTQATLSRWLKRPASIDDVKNLTLEEARDIYETNYLTGPRISTLPEPLMTQMLDMSINHGPKNAIKMLQRVVNEAGFGPIDVDGVLGPQTRKCAVNGLEAMGPYFLNALVDERLDFYRAIVAHDPSQKVFLKGWTNRAEEFRVPTKQNA